MAASLLLLLLLAGLQTASAGPFAEAGDRVIRDDVQRLADYGIITGPVSTWPLSWPAILGDLQKYDQPESLPADLSAAYFRLRTAARRASRTGEVQFSSELSAGANQIEIRSFSNTPRENFQAGVGASWLGDRLSIDLNAHYASTPDDDQELRADGSAIALALGNYTLGVSTQDRWWGPGWDGSLILSNSARPIPSLTFDRNFTDPFETRWLSWLGPWDLSIMMGQLDDDRFVPDALFFGMRFTFRPLRSLEIGITRAAQWCGEGRPCNSDTFIDLLLGQDNAGDGGINAENEPGNQLAGVDLRWSQRWFGRPVALYGQFIGEDEAGGLPSRFLGLLGIEGTGLVRRHWSYRWYGEFAGTSCNFYSSDELFDCAYTSGIYQTGYRYRGRAIGHALDADARVLTAGLVLVDDDGRSWQALARYGALNRGILPDSNHTQAPLRRELASIDVSYARGFSFGDVELSTGLKRIENDATGESETDARVYLRWRQTF